MSKKEPAVAIGKKAAAKVVEKKPKQAAATPKKVGGKKPVAKIELKKKPVSTITSFGEKGEDGVLKAAVPEAVPSEINKEWQHKYIDAVDNGVPDLPEKEKKVKAAKAKLPSKVSPAGNNLTRAISIFKSAAKAGVEATAKVEAVENEPAAPPAPTRSLDAGTFLQPMVGRKVATKAPAPAKAVAGKVSFADLKAQRASQNQAIKPAFDISKYTGRK